MKKKILYFLTHPLILTTLMGSMIILLLPPLFDKYISETAHLSSQAKTTTNAWFDFDNDGLSEEVNMFNTPLQPTIITRKNKQMIAQWILEGEYANMHFFFPADYDRNGISELYVITCSDDSLFFNGIEPLKAVETLFFRIFIDIYRISVIGKDCAVYFIKATDLNKDGYNEIVFSITTGWSAYPRKIYAVDIRNDTLYQTPESCATMISPVAYDVNGDGFDEFIPESYAFRNCSGNETFNDHTAWIMIFDRNLQYLFTPVRLGQYMSIVKIKPVRAGDVTYLMVLQLNSGSQPVVNCLMLYSIDGILLKKKNIGDYYNFVNATFISANEFEMENLFLFYKNGQIDKIDAGLNLTEQVMMNEVLGPPISRIDIDQDGYDEFIFFASKRKELIITRNDFRHPVRVTTSVIDPGSACYVSVIKSGEANPQLYFQSGENGYIFDYFKNPLYPLKYPIFAGIFLTLFALFYLIRQAQESKAKHKFEKEKFIAELQLRSIKSQIDPHFSLNLLNSLGALFDKQDKKKADYIFQKYTSLLRTTIMDSESIDSTLEGEIEYMKNYLDLEKFRYNDKFDYKVLLDRQIDLQVPVPKMLLHTFVENAVKHGIRHLDSDGLITVSIESYHSQYLITIRDNGGGIKNATHYEYYGTGKGLKIMDDILKLYKDLRKVNISYEIIGHDGNDGTPPGTSVIIKIPVEKT